LESLERALSPEEILKLIDGEEEGR